MFLCSSLNIHLSIKISISVAMIHRDMDIVPTTQWHISECKVHKDTGWGYTDTEPAEHQDMNMNVTTTTTYLLLLSV